MFLSPQPGHVPSPANKEGPPSPANTNKNKYTAKGEVNGKGAGEKEGKGARVSYTARADGAGGSLNCLSLPVQSQPKKQRLKETPPGGQSGEVLAGKGRLRQVCLTSPLPHWQGAGNGKPGKVPGWEETPPATTTTTTGLGGMGR